MPSYIEPLAYTVNSFLALLVIQTSALYNHDRKLAAVLALFGISVTMVSSVRQGIK